MELRWSHIVHLYHVFLENDGKENCAQLIEEEFNKMYGINDEHDCNIVSMNSLNIHDANDMQSHKLGDAMFDEDDVFENIFAAINVCPKLGDATFNEDDIFSLPSLDMHSCYDNSMPPTYDDYIYQSGFGEVMTLFSDVSTILEEVSIDYDENKVATYDNYCDDPYAIKVVMIIFIKLVMIMITLFLNITLLMWKQFIVFESLMILPLFRRRRILLMWRVVNFLCL